MQKVPVLNHSFDFSSLPQFIERARPIRLFISDVDGVLTDGTLLYQSNTSEPGRLFHIHDGHGIKMWQNFGCHFAIITAKESRLVTQRMQELGVQHIMQGQEDKLSAYRILKNELQVPDEEIAYIGDDNLDIPVLQQVGLAFAVQNAQFQVKNAAHFLTTLAGGQGAVREALNWILAAKQFSITSDTRQVT